MAEVPQNPRLQWAVFGILAVVEVGLIARLFVGTTEGAALLVGALSIVAVLLVITIRVYDIDSLSVGKDGIRAELKAVKEQLAKADRRIDELFLRTMSPAMFLNLKKLGSRRFGQYEMGAGLERELRHLLDVGYVEFHSIGSIPKTGSELSDFVKVTPASERFVALRDGLDSERKVEGYPAEPVGVSK